MSFKNTHKAVSSVTARTVSGRVFHMVGPATENDRSPSFVLVRGIRQSVPVDERRRRRGGYDGEGWRFRQGRQDIAKV